MDTKFPTVFKKIWPSTFLCLCFCYLNVENHWHLVKLCQLLGVLNYKAFKISFKEVLWSPVRLHSSADGAYVTPDWEWEARASFFALSFCHVDVQCWQRGMLSFPPAHAPCYAAEWCLMVAGSPSPVLEAEQRPGSQGQSGCITTGDHLGYIRA